MGVDGSGGKQETTMLKMRTWGGRDRGRVRKGDAVSEGQKSSKGQKAACPGVKQKGRKEGRRMGAGVKTAGRRDVNRLPGGRCGSRKPRAQGG